MGIKLKEYASPGREEVNMMFYCPGCKSHHPYRVVSSTTARPVWHWNGSMDSPTFSPSLLVFGTVPSMRCHLFLKDGKIQFLADCFHELRGQTVECPDVEDAS